MKKQTMMPWMTAGWILIAGAIGIIVKLVTHKKKDAKKEMMKSLEKWGKQVNRTASEFFKGLSRIMALSR